MIEGLADRVAELLVEHDPLEPWLTESHFDEGYWASEACAIAERMQVGMEYDEVRGVIVDVLGTSIPSLLRGGSESSRYAKDQIERVVAALLKLLT